METAGIWERAADQAGGREDYARTRIPAAQARRRRELIAVGVIMRGDIGPAGPGVKQSCPPAARKNTGARGLFRALISPPGD